MNHYHYVASFYDPETQACIGRNCGIHAAHSSLDPVEAFDALASQIAERMGTMQGLKEGTYFIISPYTLLQSEADQPIQPLKISRHEHVISAGKSSPVPDNDTPAEMLQCEGCWHEDTIAGWREHDGECPACNTEHADRRAPE